MEEMKKAVKRKMWLNSIINKTGQKLTIRKNLTFDHFPGSMEYIYLAPTHDLSQHLLCSFFRLIN